MSEVPLYLGIRLLGHLLRRRVLFRLRAGFRVQGSGFRVQDTGSVVSCLPAARGAGRDQTTPRLPAWTNGGLQENMRL